MKSNEAHYTRSSPRLSEHQRAFLDVLHRYGYVARRAGARLLGISPEAFRCRTRRLKRRGLVETGEVEAGIVYAHLTRRGAQALGVTPPRSVGPMGLLARLAIAEAFSRNGSKLLTHEELLEILVSLERIFGGKLALPGVPRGRWRVAGKRLAFVHVDLSPSGQITAHGLLRKLEERAKKLARRSGAWEKLVAQYLSFTVLSPWDQKSELQAALRVSPFRAPIEHMRVPLLSQLLVGTETQQS